MDFAETNEQRLLRESVRRFAARVRPFQGGKKPTRGSLANWREVAANGWTAVGLPEETGGFGTAPVEVAIILEEFGRGLVVEPFVSCVLLAARAIGLLGNAAQRALLPEVVDGNLLLAFAHEERHTRGAILEVATVARRVTGGWRLNGTKVCVYGAPQAQTLLVSARTSGSPGDAAGLSLFLVPADGTGVERTDYLTIDGFEAADIAFDEVHLPDDAMVGAEGMAGSTLAEVIDLAVVGLCAEAVGIMDRALQLTRDYAMIRRQFGQTIGSFQAVQHRLADMLAELEMSRSALHAALASWFGTDRTAQSRAASACKAYIGRAGRFVCENAIQLHGGIGMADEVEVGHHYRRLLAIDATFGNADHHLQRFADLA